MTATPRTERQRAIKRGVRSEQTLSHRPLHRLYTLSRKNCKAPPWLRGRRWSPSSRADGSQHPPGPMLLLAACCLQLPAAECWLLVLELGLLLMLLLVEARLQERMPRKCRDSYGYRCNKSMCTPGTCTRNHFVSTCTGTRTGAGTGTDTFTDIE